MDGKVCEEVEMARIEGELKKIREACGDLFSISDMVQSTSFDTNGRVAWGGFDFDQAAGMCYQRPSATAAYYINETERRLLVATSRAFCALNPYWTAIKQSRIAYNVGPGFVYSVVSRIPGKLLDKDLQNKILAEVKLFIKTNNYRQRQGEKLTRLDRDGEFFLRMYDNSEDGVLRVRFIEPLMVQTPPGFGTEGDVWFGIKFDGDYEDPQGYYVRPANYDGASNESYSQWRKPVSPDDMQHRKANVDLGSPRGVPSTYALRERLTQALSTLKSMGRLVDIRARIALIKKTVNATLATIQPIQLRNRAGAVCGPGGKQTNIFGYGYGSIIDSNDQRTFDMPAQNIETDKIVHSLKADLQSVAAAMGLADFVISADAGGNFSNAVAKEAPMGKAITCSQQDLIEDDTIVIERALQEAIDHGRLPADALEQGEVMMTPPDPQPRNEILSAQAGEIMVRSGAMSLETYAEKNGLDPDVEQPRIKANPPPAVQVMLHPPAPAGGLGGADNKRSHQAAVSTQSAGRSVPAGQEAGPSQNPQKAAESLVEHAGHAGGSAAVTSEEQAMADTIITSEWLASIKDEINTFPRQGSPIATYANGYAPGIDGQKIGTLDGMAVWSVDMRALAFKNNLPMRQTCITDDTVFLSPAAFCCDMRCEILHDCIERRLVEVGKWSDARACRYAKQCEQAWLCQLRPELC